LLQGIYRGLRDTITPLWATVGANALNLLLLPPLIFAPLNWGVAGSAAATGASQALPVLLLMVILVVRYRLRLSLRQVSLQQVAALFAPTGAAADSG
jgi:Na+-driven multidrug efflux pump